VLPPKTRNARGNEVTDINISGNLVNNCLTVVYLLIKRCPE
jgi:hypothetical protein